MEIHYLEPDRSVEPKQTVRQLRKRLADHHIDFLNVNNLLGYAPDDDHELSEDQIGDVLMMTATLDDATVLELKRRAWVIVKLTNRKLKFQQTLERMAHVFGYRAWTAMLHHVNDGVVVNRRFWTRDYKSAVVNVHEELFNARSKIRPKWLPGDREARLRYLRAVRNKRRRRI
jgi:hypothetical protein